VRHIIALLKAGHSIEEIVETCLPHVPSAALYEAVVYYCDHRTEIETELEANTKEAVESQLRERLTQEQYARLRQQTK
jgi:hypothetical protein